MSLGSFASPVPPGSIAVIFSSQRTPGDDGYEVMAQRMLELAARQPGFLGVESARGADGFGLTVSYWSSVEAVAAWRQHIEHLQAQQAGRERWYEHFELRMATVTRSSRKTPRS